MPSDLPHDLEDALADLLCRAPADLNAGFAKLVERHPEHAVALARRRAELAAEALTNAPPTLDEPPDDGLPSRIGPYQILQVLGEGGMGTVYLAEQKQPIHRRVALKVIKLGMDTKEVLKRFEAERQALSLMDHDNIARVIDGGATETGRPYFALEYVKGIPLNQYCDANRLRTRDRLELFMLICHGVQHAHQKGVIHRDLKPTNILVAARDKPVPKIIDFGLARAIDHRLVAATLFTEQGQIIGTPEYMSPEQAGLGGLDVDTRTDVYSLGVILYELLVGELPFSTEDLRRAGWLGLQQMIREQDPPKPSTRVTTLADHGATAAKMRRVDERGLIRRLRGDLDCIVMKALEKDRTRRYHTAEALADDVRRFLDDEPVLATPPSVIYRARKLYARNRVQVIAGLLLAVALVVGTIGTALGFVEANRERRKVVRLNQALGAVLSDVDLAALRANVDDLRQRYEKLGPPWPEHRQLERLWLTEARDVVARRPDLARAAEQRRTAPSDGAGAPLRRETNRVLADLFSSVIADLDNLAERELPDVEERVQWSGELRELSIDRHADAWRAAQASIRSGDDGHSALTYAGLNLEPQLGLVPLGRDPDSGLQEFYHLRSAPPPRTVPPRDANGALSLPPDPGIVFVLIPPGTAQLGTPPGDPFANSEEAVAVVRLDAFFLSKFELTQGQWKRLSGGDEPSKWVREVTHPVESVSWDDSTWLLRHHGLALPTEAQWEYACRAGSATTWSTGADASSLQGYANLAGVEFVDDPKARAQGVEPDPSIDDGHRIHAPVGSFAANAFGLHDMHGNVFEWCRDLYGWRDEPGMSLRDGDGLLLPDRGRGEERPFRGGSYLSAPTSARSAGRTSGPPTLAVWQIGVRPAREIRR